MTWYFLQIQPPHEERKWGEWLWGLWLCCTGRTLRSGYISCSSLSSYNRLNGCSVSLPPVYDKVGEAPTWGHVMLYTSRVFGEFGDIECKLILFLNKIYVWNTIYHIFQCTQYAGPWKKKCHIEIHKTQIVSLMGIWVLKWAQQPDKVAKYWFADLVWGNILGNILSVC